MLYVEPSVKLIDSTSDSISFYAWMKSRQWVIEDTSGLKFMVDMDFSPNWLSNVPEEFKVGNEVVNKSEYRDRISKMNLQYNNLGVNIYEITGSCLFRDLLFTISKISQWAQSNRFLFSILDKSARDNEDNYKISSEYKGIPEWEDQFRDYMQAIKDDPIVDHNRREMPYSIASTFWIGVNHKTLVDLLSFLKYHAPFFYEVYGTQFGVDESYLTEEMPASISQYILKDEAHFEEGNMNIQGTCVVNSKMALILYSQFVRQADTRVTGLFNYLMHKSSGEFMHEVFKGSTILNIHYVADEDRVKSTVRTRLCSFAMSSGDGPDSWSYFINNFIPKNISPQELMDLLPCKFHNCKLMECKFHDDIKFRNEGKEVSNCPCPLVSMSMKDAKSKLERDNNLIGKAFYKLTEYLISGGVPFHYDLGTVWTSKLTIDTDIEIPTPVLDGVKDRLRNLESLYNRFNKSKSIDEIDSDFIPFEISREFPGNDVTCAMKGLAIDCINSRLTASGIDAMLINFGGDIFAHGVSKSVQIEGTNFNIDITPDYDWSIFTSGNTSKRGFHVHNPYGDGMRDTLGTVIVKWESGREHNNMLCDIMATKLLSTEWDAFSRLGDRINSLNPVRISHLCIKLDVLSFKVLNPTYCASPFFNDSQVKVRDAMVQKFASPFRPDLTKESRVYNIEKDYDSVGKVVDANIEGIDNTDFLVYPMRTQDLGTLWEVGHAIAIQHGIIKYDEVLDEYHLVTPEEYGSEIPTDGTYLFDCTNKVDAISLGYISHFISPDEIYYQLKGMPDNIMLSVNYHHVELNESTNEYIEYERDKEDEDK